jgi:hypothetical protein
MPKCARMKLLSLRCLFFLSLLCSLVKCLIAIYIVLCVQDDEDDEEFVLVSEDSDVEIIKPPHKRAKAGKRPIELSDDDDQDKVVPNAKPLSTESKRSSLRGTLINLCGTFFHLLQPSSLLS